MFIARFILPVVLALFPVGAHAQATVGKPAPGFTLADLDGKKVNLASFKGKTVVLEWFNPECPFVVHAHTKGPLREMGNSWAKKGVVWLAINSGSPGKQGTGKEKNAGMAKGYGMTYPVLLDEDGKVGRAYGAKSTPHMFIIDPKGTLVYAGGLDNAPLGEAEGGTLAPYVDDALTSVTTGKAVKTSETRQYGCSVKYGS